jgi:hypothetical protein
MRAGYRDDSGQVASADTLIEARLEIVLAVAENVIFELCKSATQLATVEMLLPIRTPLPRRYQENPSPSLTVLPSRDRKGVGLALGLFLGFSDCLMLQLATKGR